MATPQRYSLRDYQFDYRQKRVTITPQDLNLVGRSGNAASPLWATPTLVFSVGSPTMSELGVSTPYGAIDLEATTDEIDVLWAVPYDFDNRQPIYIRHRASNNAIGSTQTTQFRTLIGTVAASGLFTKPTTYAGTATWSKPSGQSAFAASARIKVGANVSGANTSLVFPEATEYVQFTILAASNNYTISANFLQWLGMDLEYTPRVTFGDGSRREARKMETLLGDSEIGASNGY